MTRAEFAPYIDRCASGYAAEIVRAGATEPEAAIRAVQDTREVRADGPVGDRHRIYVVERGGEPIGVLWLGARGGWRRTWIYDIELDSRHRGRGLGRATLAVAEREAMRLGATHIGLHVFRHNTVACRLYERAGYEAVDDRPADIEMWKVLARD